MIIGGFILVIICALVVKIKGYGTVLFAGPGFLFSIIVLLVVPVIPRRRGR